MVINFQWLQESFLGYLHEWQCSIDGREDFSKGQKNMMCLSKETLDGLKITGKEFLIVM